MNNITHTAVVVVVVQQLGVQTGLHYLHCVYNNYVALNPNWGFVILLILR